MPNKYKRPEETYNTTTSTSYSNRFQDQAQQKVPLMGADLDREYNALIDNDNDLDKRLNEFVADVFPGSSAAENANKVVYSDGTQAQFSKVLERFIDSNAISTAKLQNASVTNAKVANGAISTSKLVDGSVTEAKLNNGAVSNAKLADYGVSTAKMQDAAITTQKIANNAVTTEKILDNSVTTSKFADGSFTTNKIADESLTPRKTKGCFILGELKFSVLDAGSDSFYTFREGWIPISNTNISSMIPADCFPELRDRLKKNEDDTNKLSGTTRYISLKRYVGTNETWQHHGLVYFDFTALVGAYPMLIGSTFPVQSEIFLRNIKVLGTDLFLRQVFAQKVQELETGNFTTWNIPQNALRDYVNGTIATANEGYDFAGLQQHQTPRRFGEETIKIGLDNMPAHTHTYKSTTQKTLYYDSGGSYTTMQENQADANTRAVGESKPLPHLPPSIGLYGYIYGGNYDPEGWPYSLRS